MAEPNYAATSGSSATSRDAKLGSDFAAFAKVVRARRYVQKV